jgi:nucleoside-diphosphate-sugar epimerase
MKKIFLTGSTGFVGKQLQLYLDGIYSFSQFKRGQQPVILEDIVVHLAGKAHDTKNVSQPEDYYITNTTLTRQVFDAFLASQATVFIWLSSVKSVADVVPEILTEETTPAPATHYGKSKLQAEEYILSQSIPPGKRVYTLRPCMIHGPGNKGNLNLLFQLVSKGIPWPLAAFENQRSFCSIDNLCFIIKELIDRADIPSGIYNVADSETISTNELIRLIAASRLQKPHFLPVPAMLIRAIARLGDFIHFPLNSERLQKLTESFVVSNHKLLTVIGKPLPVNAREGLRKTFLSF